MWRIQFIVWYSGFYFGKCLGVVPARSFSTPFESPVMVYKVSFMKIRRPRVMTGFRALLVGIDEDVCQVFVYCIKKFVLIGGQLGLIG